MQCYESSRQLCGRQFGQVKHILTLHYVDEAVVQPYCIPLNVVNAMRDFAATCQVKSPFGIAVLIRCSAYGESR